jgi:hypothetical protein
LTTGIQHFQDARDRAGQESDRDGDHRRALSATGDPGSRRHSAGSVVRAAESDHARCNGLFYACKDGAEARRFNRLLIDARQIHGL